MSYSLSTHYFAATPDDLLPVPAERFEGPLLGERAQVPGAWRMREDLAVFFGVLVVRLHGEARYLGHVGLHFLGPDQSAAVREIGGLDALPWNLLGFATWARLHITGGRELARAVAGHLSEATVGPLPIDLLRAGEVPELRAAREKVLAALVEGSYTHPLLDLERGITYPARRPLPPVYGAGDPADPGEEERLLRRGERELRRVLAEIDGSAQAG